MTIGWRIRNPDTGSIVMESADLGILMLDQFQVTAGSDTTRTYDTVPPSDIKVMFVGSTLAGASGATATISASGAGSSIRFRPADAGLFWVARE